MVINKVRHIMWGQGWDQIPPHIRAWMDSFDEHHPDWTTEFWDDDRIRDNDLGPLTSFYDQAARWTMPDAVWQLRSDLARYTITHQHGGVWCDADYEWFGPLDPHLQGATMAACWELDSIWLAPGMIAAVAEHPALEATIQALPEHIRRHRGQRANWLSGPKFWTRHIVDRDDVTLLPSRLLHSVPWNVVSEAPPPAGCPAVHRWNHQAELRTLA